MIAKPGNAIAIVGSGRVARALGRLLAEAVEPVSWVVSRSARNAAIAAEFVGRDVRGVSFDEIPRGCRRWLIAVPDRALSEVASRLAVHCDAGVALHTSGARGPEALAPLQAKGVQCGTLHPLQTVSGGSTLRGVAFAISGDPDAVAWAESIAALAHGEVLRIDARYRPLYHTAAVMASNYVVTLLDSGQWLLEECGVERGLALRALGPLIRTSVENALVNGTAEALTGPIERGDAETVASHLDALEGAPESIRNLYRAAGVQTLDLARRKGLDADRARFIHQLLEDPWNPISH